jgi:hypothetical protein
MIKGKITLSALAALAFACNSPPPKQAGCPSGTVEKEGSCVPPDDGSDKWSGGGDSTGSGSSGSGSSGSGSSGSSGSGSSGSSSGSGSSGSGASNGAKVPYDKQMVDQKLARAAAQANANCGRVVGDDGKPHGPWGKTTVTVTIDNNGRSRDATVPAPFDGTPVGACVTNAFNGFQYPPFAAADQKVDVEVDIKKPAGAN